MLIDEFVELLQENRIAPIRAKALHYIIEHGDNVNSKDLELYLNLPQASVSRALNWLVKQELIKRHRLIQQGQGRPYYSYKATVTFKQVGKWLLEQIEDERTLKNKGFDERKKKVKARFGIRG